MWNVQFKAHSGWRTVGITGTMSEDEAIDLITNLERWNFGRFRLISPTRRVWYTNASTP